jgi:DNA invertase Pin-like site-specific DNA recombinase
MPLRAVIYNRVSLDRRKRGWSVEQQAEENRAVCAANSWPVVAAFTDNGRSASRYARREREDYGRLVTFLEAGNADVLVTWEASRSQRDLGTYVQLRDLCMRAGVFWHYQGRTYDLTVPADRKATAQDAVAAEGYSDETSERVKRSTRAAASAGRPHGKHLFGYTRHYHPETRDLLRVVEIPEQAAVVREAVRRVLAGEALYSIARDFRQRGVPAPGHGTWQQTTTLRRVLLNPAYAGKRVHKGQIIGDAAWPPIVAEGDWYAIRSRLTDPTRRTTTRQGSVRHFLTGLTRCGVCDAPCKVLKNRGTLAYQCSAGFHVSRRIADVDELVTAVVLARLARPDVTELLLAGNDYGEVRAAQDNVRELRGRLDAFCDAAAAGDITTAALARIEARLLPEIAEAEKRAHPRSLPTVVGELAGRSDAAERWAALTLAQRRDVVDVLMVVRIMPTRRGARSFDPESVKITWRTS